MITKYSIPELRAKEANEDEYSVVLVPMEMLIWSGEQDRHRILID